MKLALPQSRRALALTLFGAVCLAFLPTLQNGFVQLDDAYYLTKNAVVHDGLSWHGLLWAFTTFDAANWHPLTWLTFMLDWQLFGAHAWGHHLIGLLLHASVAVLAFVWLDDCTQDRLRSFCVATLFALHPLRVESVAWASELKDPLSGLFFVWACLAHTRRARAGFRGGETWVTLLMALSLLAKPTAVTLPLVLLLLDRWPLARKEPLRALLLEKAPLFALSFLSSVITILAQLSSGAVSTLQQVSIAARLEHAILNVVLYLRLTLWPAGLVPMYPLDPRALPAWQAAAALAAVAVLTLVAALLFRARRAVLTGWAWFLVMLLPVIGIVQAGAQAIADRYTYLPHLGLFIACAWAIPTVPQLESSGAAATRLRTAAFAAFAALAVALGAASFRQTRYWQSGDTLFGRMQALAPGSTTANLALAVERIGQGRLPEAGQLLQRVLERDPSSAVALSNLGIVRIREGRTEEGLLLLGQARRSVPSDLTISQSYATALAHAGRHEEAIAEYARLYQLEPERPGVALGYGVALGDAGLGAQALAFLRMAVAQAPGDAATHAALGTALARAGSYPEAIRELSQALALQPDFPGAQQMLRNAREDAARR